MKTSPLLLGLAVFTCLGVPSASAVFISFDSASDFDNNFYKKPGAVGNNALLWDAGGYVQKTGMQPGGISNSAAFYNTTTSGGSGGTGGTTLGSPNNFTNFTVQADINTTGFLNNGTSFGFYTKVDVAGTAGYCALFRWNDGSGNADFRIFAAGSDAYSGTVGSQIGTTQIFGTDTDLGIAIETWYTFRLTVVDVGSDVQFTANIFAQGSSTPLGATITQTVTGGIVGAGQVGMRVNTLNNNFVFNRFDNFTLQSVPEPSVLGLLGLTAIGGLALRRRKARAAAKN